MGRRSAKAILLGIVTAAAVAAAVAAVTIVGRGAPNGQLMLRADLTSPVMLPDIELFDRHGRPARLSDGNGRVRLIFFGYTNCPDVCPLVLAQLARFYEKLGEPEDVQVLFITVDPDRDTAQRLRTYLSRFHSAFIGLTGSHEAIIGTLKAFDAIAREADPYVLHSDAVTVVDAGGTVRAIYGQSTRTASARFDAAALERLTGDVASLRERADD